MGTKFAPPYAISFMDALKVEILESLKKSWLCWRYIDDILMIWHHRENEPKRFIEKLKTHFTLPEELFDYSRVHFLDVQVVLGNN